ncbi:MAG: DnaD domain protein [Erysipelotrichaceae bacterium]|jgi:replication initiation and membrane attachment protein DnaB|nr:DnaD domain protein [Erysipelotrichaceae bacterium]
MEIKASDTYRCELSGGLSFEGIVSLSELYQPLITPQALVLYLTMAAEASSLKTQQSHARLFSLTGLDPIAFDQAVARLEEYMLVRVYQRRGDRNDSYIYTLNTPMSARSFISSSIYMKRYMNVMGQKQTETTVSRLQADSIATQGYQDITRAVVHRADAAAEEESGYTTFKPRYRFTSVDDTTINFDYERFIASTSALVYPVELRTQENLATIGKLATIYGLSADQMRILVSKCVNLKTMEFNSDKLRILASRTEGTQKASSDVYSLSPVSFLQAKQNGAEVTMTDKRMIEHLSMDMHFSNEVINVMLEYILSVSANRLNPRFVDMVAGEWARDGIETKEQALLQAKKSVSKNRNSTGSPIKVDMPEYIRQQQEGTLPKSRKATQETLDMVREMQNKMKD